MNVLPNNGVIGGPQGPKSLLDAVRSAVRSGYLDTLNRMSKDFLAIDENVVKCIDENGNSIVHLALDKSTDTLQYVIEELHADVNAVNFQGRTPLHEAVTKNYVECCELLLQNGANDSIQSATLSTPFHTAAACGSVECMEVLLKHSDNPQQKVNELDKNRSSALHKCAFDGDVRVSRWLVEHGAVVDARDNMDITPLLVAVKMGQKDVTKYLLEQKADCNKADFQGNCCVHFCAIRCDTTILKMLLDAGANPQVQNGDLNNPLHVAALHQRPDSKEWEDLVATLLFAGCDPNQENVSRKKATDYVGRGLKKIFSLEEVKRLREKEFQLQKEMEEDFERLVQQRSTWRKQVEENVAKRLELEAGEDERMQRELEEGQQLEDDARVFLEEQEETKRFIEEEIKKKKIGLEKSSGGKK
eukprot:gene5410-3897_t